MWSFLDHPGYWTGATMFLHSDNIAESLWKKRNDLPHVKPRVDKEDLSGMAKAISEYFHTKEGRGRNCKVEVYRRHKRNTFAYPEDFAGLVMSGCVTCFHASRAILLSRSFLSTVRQRDRWIFTRRAIQRRCLICNNFADSILMIGPLDDAAQDDRVYVLDALATPDFVFHYPPDSGIESVVVHKLRLSLKSGSNRRITLEADTRNDPKAVYTLMEKLALPSFHITQVEIKVTFTPTPGTRGRIRTFKIGWPNSCALRHDGRDAVIRTMLGASDIEPMAPTSESGDCAE